MRPEPGSLGLDLTEAQFDEVGSTLARVVPEVTVWTFRMDLLDGSLPYLSDRSGLWLDVRVLGPC